MWASNSTRNYTDIQNLQAATNPKLKHSSRSENV